ncbi:ABC-type sugar transport system, periplasmic component [Pseudomonas sp. GM102]|uniref:sugar ABC transporter substrate-binding protein n=1 Tax=Pseudomonas sp. GM102 TaxID=1144321 RepID=UPI00026F6F26|nr:sugar ABC transporter substrate-binding protein [Pseudomonas sp. GM102]EJM00326.1 ABC-type sugar transport system, periplasmic component [Pseudomonas sp. GM102]
MKKLTQLLSMCAVAVAIGAGAFALPGTSDAQSKKIVVGYTNLQDTDVFTMSRKTEFSASAKTDPDVLVRFADANGDISKQLDQIDNFIAQEVDVIVVVPVDYHGIVSGVKKANKAGIPVIALGIESAGGDYTFVGSKNLDAGRLQGEFMSKNLPRNAEILYLQGEPGLYHSTERLDGFTKAMAARDDVKLLGNLPGNYDRAGGMKVTEDWIQRFPKFDAIIAANDQMALGALQALKAAGRKGVMISGIDGTKDALAAIEAGEMTQSIFQNAKGQAQAAFEVVEMIKKGETPPKEKLVAFESIVKDNVTNYRN